MTCQIPHFSPLFAAIDLGSNSFQLLLARISEGKLEVVERTTESVQLARGLQVCGTLSEAAQDRALACLGRFAAKLQDYTLLPGQVRVAGTLALRTAKNTAEFLTRAESILGHSIQVLSGDDEARLVYQGVSRVCEQGSPQRLVIDIGGGSTELILGNGRKVNYARSLDIGCVTFAERYFADMGGDAGGDTGDDSNDVQNPDPECVRRAIERTAAATHAQLDLVADQLSPHKWEIALGASASLPLLTGLIPAPGNGNIITRSGLHSLSQATLAKAQLQPLALPGVGGDLIAAAIVILSTLFERLHIDSLEVTDITLAEGLIYDTVYQTSC